MAADGVGSRLRATQAETFGTTVATGRNRYAWLGTPKAFDAFTFAFERTEAGWVCGVRLPVLRSRPARSSSSARRRRGPRSGWTRWSPKRGLGVAADIFDDVLSGEPLLGPASWLRFKEMRNATWRAGNLVLAGDAAHTTHFGIGSGTVLAVQDAIALADALERRQRAKASAWTSRSTPTTAAAGRRSSRSRARRCAACGGSRRSTGISPPTPCSVAWSLFDRRGDQAPWRYQLHLATQVEPLRQARRRITTARRTVREKMRERSVHHGQ